MSYYCYWDKAKKWVKATITCFRSTKSTEMRYVFYGKWYDCVIRFALAGPNPTLEDLLHKFYPEDKSEVGKRQCDVTTKLSMDEF